MNLETASWAVSCCGGLHSGRAVNTAAALSIRPTGRAETVFDVLLPGGRLAGRVTGGRAIPGNIMAFIMAGQGSTRPTNPNKSIEKHQCSN